MDQRKIKEDASQPKSVTVRLSLTGNRSFMPATDGSDRVSLAVFEGKMPAKRGNQMQAIPPLSNRVAKRRFVNSLF
jgi:hypothetical protein